MARPVLAAGAALSKMGMHTGADSEITSESNLERGPMEFSRNHRYYSEVRITTPINAPAGRQSSGCARRPLY